MITLHSLFVFICLAVSFSQSMVDGVIAIVGNNMVLHSDVLQQSHLVAANQNIDPSKRPQIGRFSGHDPKYTRELVFAFRNHLQ